MNLNELAAECLEHLSAERTALSAVRDSLGRLHEALRSGDRDVFRAAVEAHMVASAGASGLAAAREGLRDRIRATLGAADGDACMGLLEQRLATPWSERLAEARLGLAELAEDVADAARRTWSLLAYCQDYFADLMRELERPASGVVRYGPDGTALAGGANVTIYTQG